MVKKVGDSPSQGFELLAASYYVHFWRSSKQREREILVQVTLKNESRQPNPS